MLRSLFILAGGGAWRGQTALVRNTGLSQSFDPVWTVGRAFLQTGGPLNDAPLAKLGQRLGESSQYDEIKPGFRLFTLCPTHARQVGKCGCGLGS